MYTSHTQTDTGAPYPFGAAEAQAMRRRIGAGNPY